MANRFDFELRADDGVSKKLDDITGRLAELNPELDEVAEKLKLGGKNNQSNLSDIEKSFYELGRLAKSNVQYLGDMVPPLRNFIGLGGKVGGVIGKLGITGGAAYVAGKGISSFGHTLIDAADNAYALSVAAENAGMTVKDFSQMAGAMRLLGTDSETAKNSIEGLYGTFNDGLQGRNNAVLAVMNQIHAVIYKNADGTANVLKTVESLADVLPRLSPQTQKTVTDALNLNADTLQLLREGAHLKGLLAESDAIGLTVDPKTTADLASFNRQLTEASAAWDGLKQRTVQKAAKGLLSDGSLRDTVSGFTDGATHNDAAGWGHMLGENDGPYEAVALRRMKGDKKFLAEATPQERANVGIGRMNDDLRKKYNAYYGESLTDGWQLDKEMAKNPEYFTRLNDRSNQLLLDMQLAEHPTLLPPIGAQPVDPNASSVRNNNPWNIRYAGQSGAVPAAKNFAHFQTPEEGVLAADRQLQLYTSGKSANVDHPLRTVAEIVSTASPEKDGNNTALMIKNASKELGVDPTQPLDFSNVQTRSRFLAAVFHQEGNSPYSSSNIENILTRNSNDASLLTPAAASGQAPGQMVDFKQTLSSVLKETGMKIELTVINQKTGEKQTFTGTGGSKVSAAMQFP